MNRATRNSCLFAGTGVRAQRLIGTGITHDLHQYLALGGRWGGQSKQCRQSRRHIYRMNKSMDSRGLDSGPRKDDIHMSIVGPR